MVLKSKPARCGSACLLSQLLWRLRWEDCKFKVCQVRVTFNLVRPESLNKKYKKRKCPVEKEEGQRRGKRGK